MEFRKVRKFKGAAIELNCVDYGGEGRPPMLLSVSFARRIAARMAHGRMVQLEDSNHHAPIDNPSGLVAAMAPFLAEVADGTRK